MALPDHSLSSQVISGYYLIPDNRDVSTLIDYEYGGVALSDPTQGLNVKVWYARILIDGIKETSDILIGADGVPEVSFFSGGDFTEVSLAFDQNMNPFLAYVDAGVAKFYWYDTNIAGYTITTLPEGSRSPRCCLDDKRATQGSTSDILLVYARDTSMYYREQRDRYTVEYLLTNTLLLGESVLNVGMTDKYRVQFVVGLRDEPAGAVNYRVTSDARSRVTSSGATRRLARLSYG